MESVVCLNMGTWRDIITTDSRAPKELKHTMNVPTLDAILMQYTGFKNKSGVEIYEGDIIKGKKGNSGRDTWEVYWNEKELEFGIRPVDNFRYRMHYKLNGIVKPEVIGNIYKNPELIEKESVK